MKTKTYTLGQIARSGLLKNHKGEPYKHKATILRILRDARVKRAKTPWGMGYAVTAAQIEQLNSRW